MDFFLNRYRNVGVLVVAILAQLALLSYQIKNGQEVRLIRVWAVTGVTPLARVLEAARGGTSRFFRDYFVLLDVREENKHLKSEVDRLGMENQYLREELSTADRGRALSIFQSHSPSKTLAAHIIGNTTSAGAGRVLIDRGTSSGVEKGMAVITPTGIVGKTTNVYPTASYVLLATDPSFAASVVSQKNHVRGTLRGQGQSSLMVDFVQNEQQVEQGEWFYTSGDDRIFPKGLPVGSADVVRPGRAHKEIYVTPAGFQDGLEDVLIIVEGVHAAIPETPVPGQPVHILPAPPAGESAETPAPEVTTGTEADRMLERYKAIGESQNHVYGARSNGAPNFNVAPPSKQSTPAAKESAPKQP